MKRLLIQQWRVKQCGKLLRPLLWRHFWLTFQRSLFDSKFLLYIPQFEDNEGVWVSRDQCVLDAPLDYEDKYPLLARYQAAFTNANLNTLSQFFGITLAVETFSWEHLVDELRYLKYTDRCDFDRVRVQYERLDQHRGKWAATDINLRTLR